MKKVLLICSANKDRSKTAEDYFAAKYQDIVFESAGTNQKTCNMLGTNYINTALLEKADAIYVMEQKHADAIQSVFGNSYFRKITVLHVKDTFKYGSKELIEILESKISF